MVRRWRAGPLLVGLVLSLLSTSVAPAPAAPGEAPAQRRSSSAGEVAPTFAAQSLKTAAGCATGTSTAWDQDAAVVHQTAAVQVNCHQFRGSAGQRVITYATPTAHHEVVQVLVDSAGRALCPEGGDEDGCALPADGTYRVVTFLRGWGAQSVDETYKVQVRSLSAPRGCPVVAGGSFNAPPAGALGPIRCRTVRIAEPGVRHIRGYDADNYRVYGAVYDRTGHRICNDSGYCDFPAAGDYTMVLEARTISKVIDSNFAYVTSVLPQRPSGCRTLTRELLRDSFGGPGEHHCVRLREPAGSRVVEAVPTGGPSASTSLVDATGEHVCDSSSLRSGGCELTGTGPHFVVLSQPEGQVVPSFASRFIRVDGPPSCAAFTPAAVPTGGDDFVACRSIPAGGHGARETFSWRRSTGSGGASLAVYSADGVRRCGTEGNYSDRTITCALPPGPLTVILTAGAEDATYQLGHQMIA